MKVHLEIGELVLEGFEYHDHKRIASAMQRELARLISQRGLANAQGVRDRVEGLEGPSFTVPRDRNPRTIGEEIARSVYRGMKG